GGLVNATGASLLQYVGSRLVIVHCACRSPDGIKVPPRSPTRNVLYNAILFIAFFRPLSQGNAGCGANRPAALSLKNPIFMLLTPTLMVPTTSICPSGSSATAPALSSLRSPAPNGDDQYTVSPETLTLHNQMFRVPSSPSVPSIR